jgi:hypothetical protein
MKFNFLKFFLFMSFFLLIISFSSNTEEKGTGRIKINITEKSLFKMSNTPLAQNPQMFTNQVLQPFASQTQGMSTQVPTMTQPQGAPANNFLGQTPTDTKQVVSLESLGPGPIYFKAWVKYFKYSDKELSEANFPNKFYSNNFYLEQFKANPNINLAEVDLDKTLKYIKDPSYFWLNVFENTLTVLSYKQVSYF